MTSASALSSVTASVSAQAQTHAQTQAPSPTQASTITQQPLTAPNTTSISPRIIDDPSAGIITQYLNSSGRVTSQFPSSTVVAYLRAGLTAEGFNKPQPTDRAPSSHSDSGTFA